MIAVFSLAGHLFLPLTKLFSQPLSANLYCSVQLTNAYNRFLLLIILCTNAHPPFRHGNHCNEIVAYMRSLKEPTWFFEALDDTGRREHFVDIDYYVNTMIGWFFSLCEENKEDN